MSQFWDMSRIAREFGVSLNTVQSGWRNATLRTVRAHLAAAGRGEAELGMAVEAVTRPDWEVIRKRLGLRPLKLPGLALPLPDAVTGNRPGWSQASLQRWADDTGRRDEQGRMCRSSPPGRPPGVIEQRPRPSRRQVNAR